LEPVDATTTRLLVRSRGAAPENAFGWAFARGFFEPAHFAMERRMMEGIRDFAEARLPRSRAADAAEILLWIGMFALFSWRIVSVLRRRRWALPLAATTAAALGFQLVTLVRPPVFVGAALLIVPGATLLRGALIERKSGFVDFGGELEGVYHHDGAVAPSAL
jgi:hypothetical protein